MKLTCRYIIFCLVLAGFFAAVAPARAEIDAAAKYKLQSVFIYNFISAVEWPRVVYADNIKNIDLCIIGKDRLGSVMDEVAKKAEAKGVKINITRDVAAEDAGKCNIAYISSSETGEEQQILAKLQNSPVLTVSEIPGFAKGGGIIEFTMQGSNVRFSINNHAAKQDKLKINPQLLEAALEVIN